VPEPPVDDAAVPEPPVDPMLEPPMDDAAVPQPPVDNTIVPEPPADDAPAADPPAVDDPFQTRTDSNGLRLWTDISGTYQVRARFVSFDSGSVRLQKADGRYCRIVLDKLSLSDQDLVQQCIASVTASW